jgi:eukaryotic-like serine/threonine-protein kinase
MTPLPQDWSRALTLLDQALDLQVAQREAWLAQMAADEPNVMPLLQKLLQAHGRVETHALLATLPKVKRAAQMTDGGAAGMLVGPFELLEPLGRGGMGSVWRARYADGRMKRDVAIKLPANTENAATWASLRERFARERDFMAQLQHPHIARLYDAGISDSGQPFLAMEYVAGQSIDTHCDAQCLPIRARLVIFLQVLDAVGYAHQQLVLHRDLKSNNVLVDAQGQVRLLDFGVARLLPAPDDQSPHDPDAELTERAGAAFTLGYAAPEQIKHGALSTATDVYALGVMLYRLLTGLSPYQPSRETRGSLEDAVLLATPALASSRSFDAQVLQARRTTTAALRNALRNDLDVILAKALKKNPAERYPTAVALADELRRHLAQQPISARGDGWWYRAMLFVARHRVAVPVSAVAAVALFVAATVAAWQARVSAASAAIAVKEAARANTVLKVFADLLSNADPEKNKNITDLDRQVIDQALTSAERDFADAPETLAQVLKKMGEIYGHMGVPAKYLEVQKKRVALLAVMPDASTDDVVETQLALGTALGASLVPEERAQAPAKLIQVLDLAQSKPTRPDLMVKVFCHVADQKLADSKYQEAHAFAMRAVTHAERNLPNPHPDLALAYVQQAVAASGLGEFDSALEAYKKAIAIDASGKGRGKVAQLITRANLANTEYLAGNYTAAKREALAALDFARTNLGDAQHNLTALRLRAVLGSERAGELDEAAALANELLAPELASGVAYRIGVAEMVKGQVASSRGEYARAAQAFSAAETGVQADPIWRRSLASQVATLKLRLGQASAAYEFVAPLLAEIRAETGTSSSEYSKLAEPGGVGLARDGKFEQARALFGEACAWRRATLKATHPNRVRCETYIVLTSEGLSADDMKLALGRQLKLLTTGRADRIALADSIETAMLWVGNPKAFETQYRSFPLLN